MYRFLLARRWVGLILLVVAAAVVMAMLGRWQWHRHEHRDARNALTTSNLAAAPVPVTDVLRVSGPLPAASSFRKVTAAGRYDAAATLLVRRRSLGGRIGFYVLTPLRPTVGPAVLVNRGWVPSASSALAAPDVPPPTPGLVTVTGRARGSESAVNERGLPDGQVARMSTWKIARSLPYPVLDGYLDLMGQQPAAADVPRPLPPPEISAGPHLAYAVQWWLFAAAAVVGLGVLARQEAHDPGGRARRRLPAAPSREPDAAAGSRPGATG